MTPQPMSQGEEQGVSTGLFGIGIASSIISGIAGREQGIQEQLAYEYNAAVTEQNTRDALVANQQRYSMLVSRQAATYAASGVDITRGSPLLMMAATAGRGGRQAAAISEAGNEQAALDRYYGKLAAFRGTMSGIGTFLQGISKSAAAFSSANPPVSTDNVDWSQVDPPSVEL